MFRVLVTGANGFVGSHLCASLSASGLSVRAFVRAAPETVPLPSTEYHVGNITDKSALLAAAAGMDIVVHLAARVHITRERAADPLAEFRRVNVHATGLLVEAARSAGVRHIVFASSVKAVGESTSHKWNSATAPHPVDPYGISKLEAEQLLLARGADELPNVTILRLPLVYGPGMKGNMLRLFTFVDRGWPVPVGATPNARSILFVGNAVAAIQHAIMANRLAKSAAESRGPYFVADGAAISTATLVADIAAALGSPPRLLELPNSLLGRLARLTDRITGAQLTGMLDRLFGSLEVDEREFAHACDFHPPFTRQQGMEITARWFLQSR